MLLRIRNLRHKYWKFNNQKSHGMNSYSPIFVFCKIYELEISLELYYHDSKSQIIMNICLQTAHYSCPYICFFFFFFLLHFVTTHISVFYPKIAFETVVEKFLRHLFVNNILSFVLLYLYACLAFYEIETFYLEQQYYIACQTCCA